MSTLTPEQWKVLGPYLDQALTLSGEELVRWLESLHAENPVLAGQIHELLERDRAAEHEGLLDNSPVRQPETSALAGQSVGAYRLISAIGHGGMGVSGDSNKKARSLPALPIPTSLSCWTQV
jgi:hypothetical protein